MVRSLRIGVGKLVWLLTEGGAGMRMVRGMIGRLLMLGMEGMLGLLGIGLSRKVRAVGWIEVGVWDIAGLRMEGHCSAAGSNRQGDLSGRYLMVSEGSEAPEVLLLDSCGTSRMHGMKGFEVRVLAIGSNAAPLSQYVH